MWNCMWNSFKSVIFTDIINHLCMFASTYNTLSRNINRTILTNHISLCLLNCRILYHTDSKCCDSLTQFKTSIYSLYFSKLSAYLRTVLRFPHVNNIFFWYLAIIFSPTALSVCEDQRPEWARVLISTCVEPFYIHDE